MALVGRGKEADAADEELRKMVQEGIGLVPIPFAEQAGKVGLKAAGALGQRRLHEGRNWLVERSGHAGGKAVKAFVDAASNDVAAKSW